jgi:hypothetical protein
MPEILRIFLLFVGAIIAGWLWWLLLFKKRGE